MTATEPPQQRITKRTKNTPNSADAPADQAKQPPRKRTQSAPTGAKVVRKGRKPVEGAKLRREMSWPKPDYAARALIEQAADNADRLEVLRRLLTGDAGAWLAVKVAGQVATVVVTDLVREERQRSELQRKLIMDVQRLRDAAGGGGKGNGDKQPDRVLAIVAEHYGKRS